MSLSRYEQLDQLGSSHIGEVWKCMDTNTGDEVAGLRLSEQIGATAGWDYVWGEVLRHFREFKHEYVVPARDTDREQRLVIMELMRGSMRIVLDKQKTTVPGLVRTCLRRSLEAMAALHGAGLLHGDVRPEQLLFRHDGAIRLSFSVGLKPGGVVLLRQNYNQYLAPELVNPGAGLVGPQVDLYALGITAYELLVGSDKLAELVPGVGANSPEPQKQWLRWQADLNSTLPPLKEIFRKVPEDLCRVIDGLVQKNAANRFPNAAAALALLDTTGRNADDVLVPLAEIGVDPGPGYTGPSAQQIRGKEFEHGQFPAVNVGGEIQGSPSIDQQYVGSGGIPNYSPPMNPTAPFTQGGYGTAASPPSYQVAQPVSQPYQPVNQLVQPVNQSPPTQHGKKPQKKRPLWKDPFIFYGLLVSLLIALFLGGFEVYQKYINPERTVYVVTVVPRTATVTYGKDTPVPLKDGRVEVSFGQKNKSATLTIKAEGYISQTTEELEFVKSEAKPVAPIPMEIVLQPIVTEFSIKVEPAVAKLEVVKFPDPKAKVDTASAADKKLEQAVKKDADKDSKAEGSQEKRNGKTITALDEANSESMVKDQAKSKPESVNAAKKATTAGPDEETKEKTAEPETPSLYQLITAEEPGQFTISVPFDSEVTLSASAEGYKKNETVVLKGTGKEEETLRIKLEDLVTVYTINLQPEGLTAKNNLAIAAKVDGEEKPLAVNEGKASLPVPWKTTKSVEFTAEGYEKEPGSFEGTDKEKDSRTIVLTRSPTVYLVQILTKDATVELNEVPVAVAENLAEVRVPFGKKKSVLKVSRKYHKDVTADVEWNETLVGKLDPISLEAEARPLELKVLPTEAEWEIHINDAQGELAEVGSDGKAMIPNGIEKFVVAAVGFREIEKKVDDELFKQSLSIQLISSSLPEGLQPVEGTEYSATLSLPIQAKLTLPDQRGDVEFLLMEPKEFPFGAAQPKKSELASKPAKVTTPYYLGKTEVSNRQFGKQVAAELMDHPVANIHWVEASDFSKVTHVAGRLPTEVEWEAAATDYGTRTYSWGNDDIPLEDVLKKVRLSQNQSIADDKSVPVASMPESMNSRGFLHMFGNVQEFCADKYVAGVNDTDGLNVAQQVEHVTRGCSFYTPWPSLGEKPTRLTWRSSKSDTQVVTDLNDVGFRILIDVRIESTLAAP